MKEKLKSRKLWITVLSCLVGVFYPAALPLLKVLTPSYLVAQGAVDAALALRAKT